MLFCAQIIPQKGRQFYICVCQAHRQGGSKGFARNPLLSSKKLYIHSLIVHFKCPTVWSSPLVSQLLRKSMLSKQFWLQLCMFFHGGPAQNAQVSCVCCCDEKMCINICVNKLLFQVLEFTSCSSNDVTPPAVLSSFYHRNLKSARLANEYMDSQKLDA